MKFMPFWLDTNSCFGLVDSPEKWQQVASHHKITKKELLELARATMETENVERGRKKTPKKYVPEFGLYSEHNYSMTLEEWAKKNGMYKILI